MGVDEMIAFCRGYLPECDTKKNVIKILEEKITEQKNTIKPVRRIIDKTVDSNGMEITMSVKECSACGHRLEKYEQYDWGSVGHRFCGGCGQAIDWSEEC